MGPICFGRGVGGESSFVSNYISYFAILLYGVIIEGRGSRTAMVAPMIVFFFLRGIRCVGDATGQEVREDVLYRWRVVPHAGFASSLITAESCVVSR